MSQSFSGNAYMVQGLLQVPIEGSVALFLAGAALHLFATTSLGIFMVTLARSMPQFGLLLMPTLIPLHLLSGGFTPSGSRQFRMRAKKGAGEPAPETTACYPRVRI